MLAKRRRLSVDEGVTLIASSTTAHVPTTTDILQVQVQVHVLASMRARTRARASSPSTSSCTLSHDKKSSLPSEQRLSFRRHSWCPHSTSPTSRPTTKVCIQPEELVVPPLAPLSQRTLCSLPTEIKDLILSFFPCCQLLLQFREREKRGGRLVSSHSNYSNLIHGSIAHADSLSRITYEERLHPLLFVCKDLSALAARRLWGLLILTWETAPKIAATLRDPRSIHPYAYFVQELRFYDFRVAVDMLGRPVVVQERVRPTVSKWMQSDFQSATQQDMQVAGNSNTTAHSFSHRFGRQFSAAGVRNVGEDVLMSVLHGLRGDRVIAMVLSGPQGPSRRCLASIAAKFTRLQSLVLTCSLRALDALEALLANCKDLHSLRLMTDRMEQERFETGQLIPSAMTPAPSPSFQHSSLWTITETSDDHTESESARKIARNSNKSDSDNHPKYLQDSPPLSPACRFERALAAAQSIAFLDVADLLNYSHLASPTLFRAISAADATIGKRLHSLGLASVANISHPLFSDCLLAALKALPHLIDLDLSNTSMTDSMLRDLALACGSQLLSLDLRQCGDISEPGLCNALNRCPKLHRLFLAHTGHQNWTVSSCIGDSTLKAIAKSCQELHMLDISQSKLITDHGILALIVKNDHHLPVTCMASSWDACLPQLQHIYLSGCIRISSRSLIPFVQAYCNPKAAGLRSLYISSCKRVTDVLIDHIANFCAHSLERLRIDDLPLVSGPAIMRMLLRCHKMVHSKCCSVFGRDIGGCDDFTFGVVWPIPVSFVPQMFRSNDQRRKKKWI